MSDKNILKLFNDRDESAISQVAARYGGFMLSIAYRILQDRQDAEECVNDAYLKIWNSIPPDSPDNFSAYTAVLVRRIAIDRYRHKHSEKEIPPGSVDCIDELSDVLHDIDDNDGELLREIINTFLDGLSKRDRMIFVGRYYFSKPIDEVARDLGCSRSTVNKAIAGIKSKLRAELLKNGIDVY